MLQISIKANGMVEKISQSKKTLVCTSESGNLIGVPSNGDMIHVCQHASNLYPSDHSIITAGMRQKHE